MTLLNDSDDIKSQAIDTLDIVTSDSWITGSRSPTNSHPIAMAETFEVIESRCDALELLATVIVGPVIC